MRSTASSSTAVSVASSRVSRSRTGWTGARTARRSTTSTPLGWHRRVRVRSLERRTGEPAPRRRARVSARDRLRRRDLRRHRRRSLGRRLGRRRGTPVQPGGRAGQDGPASRDATHQLRLCGRVARRPRDHVGAPWSAPRRARAPAACRQCVLLPPGVDGPAAEPLSLPQLAGKPATGLDDVLLHDRAHAAEDVVDVAERHCVVVHREPLR